MLWTRAASIRKRMISSRHGLARRGRMAEHAAPVDPSSARVAPCGRALLGAESNAEERLEDRAGRLRVRDFFGGSQFAGASRKWQNYGRAQHVFRSPCAGAGALDRRATASGRAARTCRTFGV